MIIFIAEMLLKFYAIFVILAAMFFIMIISKIFIVKLNRKKIAEFVDYFFFEIFENKTFTENPKYEYKIDYHCHYHCRETCAVTDHNRDIKEAALFVLNFPELDDYLKNEVKPFHAKFLNKALQEKLKRLVLKKMEIRNKYCGGVSVQTQTSTS